MPAWKLKSIPITYVTVFYLFLLTFLSALTSIVRLQTYNELKASQPVNEESPEIHFSEIVVPTLQLVPVKSIFYPWTLLSESFLETSVPKFIASALMLYTGVNYLERHWNLHKENKLFSETIHYLTIVSLATNASSVVLKFVLGSFLKSSDPVNLPLAHGGYSIAMSFIVVLKQLSPEHNLKLFKTFSIRIRQLPFILLLITLLVSVLTSSAEPVIPVFNNFYLSWFYLRYYQINNISDLLPSSGSQQSTVRGDASDTFAFIQFFPDRLHRVLRPLCRLFYHSSAFLGIIRPFNDDDIESGNLRTIKRLNTKVSTVTADIADRRRQVALKVLGERVGMTPANNSSVPISPATPATPSEAGTAPVEDAAGQA